SANHRRHTCIITVTDSDGFALLEINAVEMLDEGCDEVLPCLFAVADNIDACLPLIVEGQTQGIKLAGYQFLALQFPRRPKFLRLCKPGRFWQAAGGRRGEECVQVK